ncbi:MAG: HD domain-containing protein [Proteobacteria bacterium]|nr:HD domain-containing protein [Desulfobulbaceae bacterium]MBU4153895.1 HD domain-containing protein [Pseudomonadota bacterium]
MNTIVLQYSVYDLNNRLLVEAGTELTPEFMVEFCQRNRESYPILPLLGYGTLRQDLLQQFILPPYNVIFSQKEKVAEILAVMEQVRLPLPLLEGMDYFRHNDFHTYRHMLMIFALTTLIAEELSPENKKLVQEEMAHTGPTHDFGKIAVPLSILLKKEPLTPDDYSLLRHHTLTGYVLLSHYLKDPSNLAALISRDHHERINGSGYPRGIHQRNLKIEITTVADIYDALIAQRPYRPVSFDNRSALEELTWMAQRGEIGWDVVHILVSFNRRNKPSVKDFQISMECRGREPEGNLYGLVADKDSKKT